MCLKCLLLSRSSLSRKKLYFNLTFKRFDGNDYQHRNVHAGELKRMSFLQHAVKAFDI